MALGCKSYTGYNSVTGETKRGTKGIPHSVPLELQQFLDCLYGREKYRFRLQTLQNDINKKMTRMSKEKVGLTDFYVKMHVHDDQITCSPLRINGRLL